MAKITPSTSITQKGVESAIARARAGEEGEIKDGACKGLALRMRGGTVSWTIRWKWNDTYKRWSIGNHEVPPDEARRRGCHVNTSCHRALDPTATPTACTTGASLSRHSELARTAPATSPQ